MEFQCRYRDFKFTIHNGKVKFNDFIDTYFFKKKGANNGQDQARKERIVNPEAINKKREPMSTLSTTTPTIVHIATPTNLFILTKM